MTNMKIVEHRATRQRELDSAERLRVDRAAAALYSPEKLRQARIRADIPQSVVARALCVKIDLVRQWERGERTPAGPSLLRLQILYGIGAEVLVEETLSTAT